MSRAFDIGIESLAQANTVTPASAPLPAEDLHPSNSTPPPSPGQKSFYIETFGCQMNVHDSEKVAGVLLERGYRAVDTAAEADFLLYNTCSIREKAAQKVFPRLERFQVCGEGEPEDDRRAGLRGAAGRRRNFRARAVGEPGMRLGELSQAAGIDRASWNRADGASRALISIRTKHSKPKSRAAIIPFART